MSPSPGVPDPEVSAAAASDAYTNRSQSDVIKPAQVFLNHHEYQVFDYKDNPKTGFHATAYQDITTHEIIIAYRGTDPDILRHTRTTFQDAAVDATMVKDRVNPQEADAQAFTQEVLDKAQKHGIFKDKITVAGHSLGGALAEIEAWKFGLRGATFNGYGAVDLGYKVPEGGQQLTNYVMAGDPVSAASHHFGEVKVLATKDDIDGLKAARYLDAPPGSPPPNPLLAMSLRDHSVTHFAPKPDSKTPSVLTPVQKDATKITGTIAEYEANYANNKAAIDHYRNDMYTDRAELAAALRNPDSRNLETTWAHLSPQLQQQLAEFHAAKVDTPLQNMVEHNIVIDGAEQGLEQASVALRTTGQSVQALEERAANNLRQAGDYAAPVVPAAPLVGAVLAEGAHLDGQAAQVVGQFAADQAQGAKHLVEQGAHVKVQLDTMSLHAREAALVVAVDGSVDAYQAVKATNQAMIDGAIRAHDSVHQAVSHGIDATQHAGSQAYDSTRQAVSHGIDATQHAASQAYDSTRQAVSHGIDATQHAASQAYDSTRQAVSQGVEATEHAASQAYDTLTHPGQWFGQTPTPSPTHAQGQASTPTGSTHARNDPRNPDSPDHALYNELHRRIPDASENRLLQFTAACHTNKITADNLYSAHLDEANMTLSFRGSSPLSTPANVDLKTPPPQPQQTIQQIQQHDQQQTQMMNQIQAQNAQVNQQGQTR